MGGGGAVALWERGILVPRGCDPFGQHQKSSPLARPDFLSMRRFGSKSMNHGLLGPVAQKPVNANLGSKINQGFCISSLSVFQLLIFSYRLKAAKV